MEEVLMATNKKNCINEISLTVGCFAVQAMLYEATCFPSPGLVSPVSTGSHKDMDYFTFLDSTAVLSKYMHQFVRLGFSNNSYGQVFKVIRGLGKKAEKDMFLKTNGVNTHKGALFLLGMACAATGKAIYEKREFREIQNIIIGMTDGLVRQELENINGCSCLTHGEVVFLKFHSAGVRGEATAGLPTVFNNSLDFFRRHSDMPMNHRLIHTLIEIMSICDDSTILYRHGPDVLEWVKATAQSIIKIGGMKSCEGKRRIEQLCLDFIDKNISPGGSADLLGVTVFFYFVEQYMNKTVRSDHYDAMISKELCKQ